MRPVFGAGLDVDKVVFAYRDDQRPVLLALVRTVVGDA